MTPASPPSHAVLPFVALLRDHGMRAGPAEVAAMLKAWEVLGEPLPQLSHAWRAIVCSQRVEWQAWPDLFERYWFPHKLKGTVHTSQQTRKSRDLRQVAQIAQDMASEMPTLPTNGGSAMAQGAGAGEGAEEGESQRAQGGATATDPLHNRSQQMWMPADLAELSRMAKAVRERLRQQPTRRWHRDSKGKQLDLRQTFRRSVGSGGVSDWVWRSRQTEPLKLYILVDVSRSVDTHAAFLLRVARAFVQEAEARAFVFHTRLAEVTPLLLSNAGTVQEKINAVTAGFGGGTRIATSVDDFSRHHVRAQWRRGARVWIFSDGFDADEPTQLATQLAQLRARGAKITWFTPTAKAPASAAYVAAQRFVHQVFTLSDLNDLRSACAHLT